MEINNDINTEINAIKQRFSIIGNAKALLYAVERAYTVAPYDQSVLVTGESGVGKEFFPKIIHNYSARKHNKYIAVNCGAIPEGTIDSELFGHEKGSFTGAISSRKGYFEEANGGTIFLDEVAELPLTTQARLLRVLENGEYIRVGSSEVLKTDIRVVAATNKNMLRAVSEGKFREDLYYRLSTVTISVPALRERGDDILLLARKFLADFAERYRTPRITLSDSAKRTLLSYRWPGNVRQLKNVIEQISLFKAGQTVEAEDITPYLPQYDADFKPIVMGTPSFDYSKERELLFKMILRLQKEIEELKQTVEGKKSDEPAGSMHPSRSNILDNETFAAEEVEDLGSEVLNLSPITPQTKHLLKEAPHTTSVSDMRNREVHDVVPESTQLTLEDTERETIRRSLIRNGGKRKKTADELNISERTLYRKIEKYGLDDLDE
ncbi:MAG: sigma-54 interaction domain-containing protein [Muribaculaceae bacterium]